jgi:glycosyltransferase involved in cell wall biosynthesis
MTILPELASTRRVFQMTVRRFNQARFLADAIKSLLIQTHQGDEIIVVRLERRNGGRPIPNLRLIWQDNRGSSAARDTGLRSCTTNHVVSLDADDRLLPTALQAGLAFISTRPNCAFVYGGFCFISEDSHPIGPDYANSIERVAHLVFMCGSPISVLSIALYRQDC